MEPNGTGDRAAYVEVVEQPAPKALRFRYECEGRSAGSLPGAKSTSEKKTFPKIKIVGYSGRAVVVVSCVTVDPPYRPHPHNLVGKEGCKKGVCTMEIGNEDMSCEFSNLGIQCVKKKDIEESLRVRAEIRVDPFRTGFSHSTQPGSIDLNSVRLCFQVFLEGPDRGQFKQPLKPVVSEPIYDKKAINDLTIMKLSDCTSPVVGNKEIILLCDKVSKDDIEIRFYEEDAAGGLVWEAFGDFQPADVHKQYAISFRTPQYRDLEITSPSSVYVQLRCPSKDTISTPRPFNYLPLVSDAELLKRKRLKLSENTHRLNQYFHEATQGGFSKRPRVASFPPLPGGNMGPVGNSGSTVSHPSPPLPGIGQGQMLNMNSPSVRAPLAGPSHQIHLQHQQIKLEPPDYSYGYTTTVGFSGGGLTQTPSNEAQQHYFQQMQQQSRQPHQQSQQQQREQPGEAPSQPNQMDTNLDDLNISLPNLSDVNLSLLENHLSENFSTNLVLMDPDVDALGGN